MLKSIVQRSMQTQINGLSTKPRSCKTSCPVFLFFRECSRPGPSPDDWAAASVRGSTWKRQWPLSAVQVHGTSCRGQYPRQSSSQAYQRMFPNCPISTRSLKMNIHKIRQKQQNTKSFITSTF